MDRESTQGTRVAIYLRCKSPPKAGQIKCFWNYGRVTNVAKLRADTNPRTNGMHQWGVKVRVSWRKGRAGSTVVVPIGGHRKKKNKIEAVTLLAYSKNNKYTPQLRLS